MPDAQQFDPSKPFTVQDAAPSGFDPAKPFTVTAAESKKPSMADRAAALLPSVGGAIGSMAGGTLGAVAGGMAGRGYQTIYKNAPLIGPAIVDVAKNLISQPAATLQGFKEGAESGGVDAGGQGAIQGAVNIGGNLLSAGAAKLAPALMKSAIHPAIVKEAIQATKYGDVPQVVKTLLDEGATVTPLGIAKLNEIITNVVPASARQDAAVAARNAVAKRLEMGNANGLGSTVASGLGAAAGYAAGGFQGAEAGSAIGFIANLVQRSPAVRSMIAKGLYKSAEIASGVPAHVIRSAVAAIAAGNASPQEQP